VELLTQFLGKEGYYLVTATTPEESDRVLMDADDIGLALIDIAGFERSIWERCEGLRAKQIPFLVLSPEQSTGLQQTSLTHGPRGVMIKPVVVKELLGVIRSLLEVDE
jgi:DNA-binding response OmpR family regulator